MEKCFVIVRSDWTANLEHLELRPQMLLLEESYNCMCQYLLGYLDGVSIGMRHNLNLEFTKWIQAKVGKKSNFAWPQFVWHTIGEKEDSLAKKALIACMREFLNDNVVWTLFEKKK